MFYIFQSQPHFAKPVLRKAIEISQQSTFWHCRLLFQLAVSTGSPISYFRIHWNASCEAIPFHTRKVDFQEGLGVEINMFRSTLMSTCH